MEEKKIKKEYFEKIELMRKEIDIIDNELMNNFSKRFEIVEKIGNLKKDFSVPALQKARWEEVLSRIIKKGSGKNFDENFIKDIWERIHEESLKIEEK